MCLAALTSLSIKLQDHVFAVTRKKIFKFWYCYSSNNCNNCKCILAELHYIRKNKIWLMFNQIWKIFIYNINILLQIILHWYLLLIRKKFISISKKKIFKYVRLVQKLLHNWFVFFLRIIIWAQKSWNTVAY